MRALLLIACLAACSPQVAGEASASSLAGTPARHPESGLEIIPLRIVTPAGAAHEFAVEVARTGEEQMQGLMYRTELGADEGMLFPREVPRLSSFWMKNTHIPLDIVFIGPDRRVINVAANTTPHSLEPIPSAGPARAVLEIGGGRAAELGIVPGSAVEW